MQFQEKTAMVLGPSRTSAQRLYGSGLGNVLPVLLLVLVYSPGFAQWTGAVSDDLLTPGNWTEGTAPAQGQNRQINSLGVSGNGAILDGVAVTSNINVGVNGVGMLTIRNGGQLTVGLQHQIGSLGAGVGTLIVTGAGSVLNATGGTGIRNNNGIATFTVTEGGTINTVAFELGYTNGTGTLNIGSGGAAGYVNATSGIQFGNGTATLNFNHTDSSYTLGSSFSMRNPVGTNLASINHLGSGRTTLTGNSIVWRGSTDISAGTLAFAGITMNLTGDVTVGSGATLAIGQQIERTTQHILDITGNLILDAGAIVEMGIGLPGLDLNSTVGSLNDAIHVSGDLALNGTLNLYDLGNGSGGQGIGFGRYELFTYGTLVENTMTIGSIHNNLPGSLQNDGGNNRIVLVIEQALGDSAWWAGGNGTWSNDPAVESWSALDTREEPLFAWNEGKAIFNGAGGVVTVTDDVNFTEISFEANGYVIADGGGDVLGKPADPEQNVVNLNAISAGITGEIAAGLRESRPGLQMRKYGPGTIILSSDDNAWTGGTNLEGGTLQIGNGQDSGKLPGNVINGGILAFNRNNTYTYDGVISAGGQVRQIGSGTTILTGASNYGGQTAISNGTLQIGNASQGQDTGSIGTGAVSIGATGTLAFDRSGAYVFGNAISGTGTVSQLGGGLLTLSGNLSTFSGKLRAQNGDIFFDSGSFGGTAEVARELTINGTMTGAATVLNGGTLRGTGSVGGATIQTGGRLSPGNSIGTMTVNGNLTFQSGSFYDVEANNAAGADRVNVTGTGNVILNGTVQVLADPFNPGQWRPLNRYTILTYTGSRVDPNDVAAGPTAFTDLESNLAFLTPRLEYGTGIVYLHLDRNDIDFASVGLTPNQIATGGALQSLGFEHPVTLDGVPLYDQVTGMTHADAQAAFDALSGEVHASTVGMLLDDSRLVRDTLLDQAFSAAGQDNEGRYWLKALGHRGSTEGDGTSEFKRDAIGVLVGWDRGLAEGALNLGWSLGYHTNASTEVAALHSEGETNNAHAALYGGSRLSSGVGMRLGLAYSWHEADITRTVIIPGHTEPLKSRYDGSSLQGFGEIDYLMAVGNVELAPFANLAWVRVETDAFQEADFRSPMGSTAALEAQRQQNDATFAVVGTRGSLALMSDTWLRGKLGYRRVLSGEDPSVRMSFLDGGQSFEIVGAPMAKDALVADLGLDWAIGEQVRLGASYNGLLGGDATDHAIQARVVWTLQ